MKTWNFDINYSTNSNLTEPDLRNEFRDTIFGKAGELPRGHWIVFRKSDISRRSQYWNEERQESIGGPPFEYIDILTRARYNSFTSGKQENRDLMGLTEKPVKLYHLDYSLKPKKEDYILEIQNSDQLDKPNKFIVTAKYDILLVDEPRDEHGRIEYYICYCSLVGSRGDKTLENIVIGD